MGTKAPGPTLQGVGEGATGAQRQPNAGRGAPGGAGRAPPRARKSRPRALGKCGRGACALHPAPPPRRSGRTSERAGPAAAARAARERGRLVGRDRGGTPCPPPPRWIWQPLSPASRRGGAAPPAPADWGPRRRPPSRTPESPLPSDSSPGCCSARPFGSQGGVQTERGPSRPHLAFGSLVWIRAGASVCPSPGGKGALSVRKSALSPLSTTPTRSPAPGAACPPDHGDPKRPTWAKQELKGRELRNEKIK
ncbi:PREDICTED: regulator of G-protein signaling 19 isoform X4 [Hipposideros armiger]|uniref:Regulator of G-protein signaling 19 isoform X4 n=1 Tax=Hipposideros armiger TaxID=186990 RepID=A0A8B7QYL3_HIPAR|nr:PREDICTED: regulator of G-protein signaling 19 isoform X4 [Hipposideros armiger]